MHGYVDPFTHRLKTVSRREETAEIAVPAAESEQSSEQTSDDDDEHEKPGRDAIVEDLWAGRREALFANDPSHRIRPIGG